MTFKFKQYCHSQIFQHYTMSSIQRIAKGVRMEEEDRLAVLSMVSKPRGFYPRGWVEYKPCKKQIGLIAPCARWGGVSRVTARVFLSWVTCWSRVHCAKDTCPLSRVSEPRSVLCAVFLSAKIFLSRCLQASPGWIFFFRPKVFCLFATLNHLTCSFCFVSPLNYHSRGIL